MTTDVIVLGAGGHTRVLLDILLQNKDVRILGILDINPTNIGRKIFDIEVLGDESEIERFSNQTVQLVNGIGSINLPHRREAIYVRFKKLGYQFFSVIHPNCSIATNVKLLEGVQVMAGAVIQTGAEIGNNVLVNTHVSIDHDCLIQDHVHLAPGAILSGHVTVGESSHIGTGAVIVQGITLGDHSLVGAGAVVIREVFSRSRVIGVPAKEIA